MATQLVSPAWLHSHLGDDNIIILDASASYEPSQTIAGAQHFDIKNRCSDPENPLPNSFPSAVIFEEESQKLGINNTSHIIVYDSTGVFTSPRVWFMYKSFGHDNISVLDGGLPAWKSSGFAVTPTREKKISKGDFKARLKKENIKSLHDLEQNINDQTFTLLDARSSGRFKGTAPEPRPQLQSGHIKNSLNLPYTEVLENGKFKSIAMLKETFTDLRIANKPIVFSCGSGITACIILLAYDLISDKPKAIYDGSWTEWATEKRLFAE